MTWTIIYSIEDEKGKISSTQINAPDATTFDDAKIFAGEMAKLIDPLMTGAITRIGLSYNVSLTGLALTAAPAANSDVEEGARFQFKTTNGFYTGLRLPTFDEAKIISGSRDVDTTDGQVGAFVTAMVTGLDITGAGGSGTIAACDGRDEDIAALDTAREQFMSSRG